MSGNISFASFNLYNFQEAGKNVYKTPVSQQVYDAKLDWTREMVKKLDADIIAFQELWSKNCLEDVFNVSTLSNYELVYLKDSWYGIAVALAVRSPWKLENKTLIKNFPFNNIVKVDEQDGEDDEVNIEIKRFSRTIIKAELKNNDQSVPNTYVFATHLKAKLPTRVKAISNQHERCIGSAISTIRRTAEAAALRWILTDHLKNNSVPTVVLGDLNDAPNSNTLALLTEQPSLSSSAKGRDTALYSALQLQQLKSFRDIFYTHEFNRLKDTLDHILVSEEFFESSNDAKWKHEYTRVWNDFIEDDLKFTSDHGVIKASFKFL